MTVATFTPGDVAYLPTAFGPKRVTYIRVMSDGPWVVTGTGLDEHSFAVCLDNPLHPTAKAAAKEQAAFEASQARILGFVRQ